MSPLGLAERCKGPNILPAFKGSWCEGNLPSSTRGQGRFAVAQRPPNLSWRHLLRPSSFCRPCPGHARFHPLMVLPRGQSCNAGLAHLDTEASVTPSMWRNSRFQPVLKGQHVNQAQLKYRRRLRPWGHEAQPSPETFFWELLTIQIVKANAQYENSVS